LCAEHGDPHFFRRENPTQAHDEQTHSENENASQTTADPDKCQGFEKGNTPGQYDDEAEVDESDRKHASILAVSRDLSTCPNARF